MKSEVVCESASAMSGAEQSIVLEKFPRGLVALDLETTGLSPLVDQIVELAAVKLSAGGELSTFATLVNPQKPISQATIDVHQITDAMVADAPTIEQVLPNFLAFVQDLPLVAHNAKFDLGFLVLASHKFRQGFAGNNIYCSCRFARKALPELKRYRLSFLATHFALAPVEYHRALSDAMTCLQVFARAMEQAPQLCLKQHGWQCHTDQYSGLEGIELAPIIRRFLQPIAAQAPLLIHYRGGSLKQGYRPVLPSSLLPLPRGPVLYALCLISGQYKSFSLKKIAHIKAPEGQQLKQLLAVAQKLRAEKMKG